VLFGQFDRAHAIKRGFEAFQRGEVDELDVKPLIERTVDVVKGEPIDADVYEEAS